jgi:hypothetical protein
VPLTTSSTIPVWSAGVRSTRTPTSICPRYSAGTNRATSTSNTSSTTSTASADTPGSAWTNEAATRTTYAGTSGSIRTNGTTRASGCSAGDGTACLASACSSRITGSALETRATACQPEQASYKKSCYSRWHPRPRPRPTDAGMIMSRAVRLRKLSMRCLTSGSFMTQKPWYRFSGTQDARRIEGGLGVWEAAGGPG